MPTVPALRIPREYVHGIAVAKSLSVSQVNQVAEVLGHLDSLDEPAHAVQMLRPVLADIPESDILQLVNTLYSLYSFFSYSDVSIDRFVGDLSIAVKESENKELQIRSPDELVTLTDKFKSLLTIPTLSLLSKARGLRYDFANIFWDAKIISDIRPVWDGSAKLPPQGIAITQTLKLEYHHAGGHGEIYVALDNEDIEKLLSVLERARDKAATLKSLATANRMKILGE